MQERLSRGETAEVEGLRPGFLIEVGDKVIVAGKKNEIGKRLIKKCGIVIPGKIWEYLLVDERHVLPLAGLSSSFYIFLVSMAVGAPPLDVLASDSSVGFAVFLQHGEESVALFGGFAVHLLACDLVVS